MAKFTNEGYLNLGIADTEYATLSKEEKQKVINYAVTNLDKDLYKHNDPNQKAIDRAFEWYKGTSDYSNARSAATAKAQEQTPIEKLSTFSADYEKNNPFTFDKNNPYLQTQQRTAENQLKQASTGAASMLAQRGTTDSGQAYRTGAQLAGQAQGQMSTLTGQDYLRQMGEYQNKEGTAYNQALTGYNLGFQEKQAALDQYYKDQAIQQQQALLEFQEEQANDPWNKYIQPLMGFVGGIL